MLFRKQRIEWQRSAACLDEFAMRRNTTEKPGYHRISPIFRNCRHDRILHKNNKQFSTISHRRPTVSVSNGIPRYFTDASLYPTLYTCVTASHRLPTASHGILQTYHDLLDTVIRHPDNFPQYPTVSHGVYVFRNATDFSGYHTVSHYV